jgi:hypothetical protein
MPETKKTKPAARASNIKKAIEVVVQIKTEKKAPNL